MAVELVAPSPGAPEDWTARYWYVGPPGPEAQAVRDWFVRSSNDFLDTKPRLAVAADPVAVAVRDGAPSAIVRP